MAPAQCHVTSQGERQARGSAWLVGTECTGPAAPWTSGGASVMGLVRSALLRPVLTAVVDFAEGRVSLGS